MPQIFINFIVKCIGVSKQSIPLVIQNQHSNIKSRVLKKAVAKNGFFYRHIIGRGYSDTRGLLNFSDEKCRNDMYFCCTYFDKTLSSMNQYIKSKKRALNCSF